MPCFINLCRCCLSSDIHPATSANEYLCKKEEVPYNTTNYYEHIGSLYPDLQLKRTLPFILCNDCQRLLWEATTMKHYLDYQTEDKQSQQLLIKESTCSGCTQFCLSLFDKMNVSKSINNVFSKSYINILKRAFPQCHFQSHISYKYCQACSNYVKSVYLLKELLLQNNAMYEKHCSTLIAYSDQANFSSPMIVLGSNAVTVDCNYSTETDMFIKEDLSISSDSIEIIEIKFENNYDFGNNLSIDIRGDNKIDKQQIYDQLEICEKHFRTPSDQKLHQCTICNKEFKTKWRLKSHKRTHASRTSRPYKCELCDGAFFKQDDFIAHMNSHKGVQPYTCNYCGKQFIRKNNCRRHVKEHEDKPYTCGVCNKTFHRAYALKEHMRVHTGARPYSCHICGKTSSNKSNHNKHVKIHHAREPVSTEG